MVLNTQGIISAVTIAIYVPIFFLALRIVFRYGIRERGWLLLVIFSLIRIAGGGLLVAAESTAYTGGLYIGGYALEASGLSPLLLSTLGLLEIVTEGVGEERKFPHLFKILHLVGIAALLLIIIGITSSSGDSTTETERRVGVLLFVGLYIILIAVTALQWRIRYQIMKFRKQLLIVVSAALPFLAIRTLYSVLSTFSSSSFIARTDPNNALAEFNIFSGSWQIYVVMEVVMEYIVVVMYTIAGNKLHLDQDYKLQETDEYPLYRPRY